MKQRKEKRVLSDHKRSGTRFVPPLLQLGPFHDPRWRQVVVPEILWLALLAERHGQGPGAELALSLARASTASFGTEKFFGMTSSYALLSDDHKRSVRHALRASGKLDPLADGLLPLLVHYPDCPLCFLFDNAVPTIDHPQAGLTQFKNLLTLMYDRRSREATIAQSGAVYIAFVTDKLKAAPHTSLARFPEVQFYPETEDSRQVAAAVRNGTNLLAETHGDPERKWPRYFWNRGFRIEPCDLAQIYG